MNIGAVIKNNKWVRLVIIAGVILIADLITKEIILRRVALYETIPVISGFFNITHIHNTGGAFGVFSQASPLILFAVAFFAACFVIYFYALTPDGYPVLAGGLALILGGAVGNLVDRVRFGSVVDFLDFYIGSYHWPAFNVADSAITVGGAILLYHVLFQKIPE